MELVRGKVLLRFQTRGQTIGLHADPGVGERDLQVDSRSREVWIGAGKVEPPLSRKEFDVLSLLFDKRGQACSKNEIAAAGWSERQDGDVGDQEIEQTIRRLRLRIEPDPSRPRFVITVRGYGYKLALE